MNKHLVSVIIPAYNAGEFIVATLQSVVAQTYGNLEIIVVDDGSTDRTVQLVEEFRPKLVAPALALTLIEQPNGGPSRARNAAIEAARGEFIAFLDADDLWQPETLARMVAAMEQHPQCGLVFGDASSFDASGTLTPSVFAKSGRPPLSPDGCVEKPFNALLENNFILTGAVLMRKTCLLETGCFDETIRYGEDAGVWLRAALLAPMALIPEVLLHRRIHEGNLSNVALNKKIKCDYLAIKLYLMKKLHAENIGKNDWVVDVIENSIMKTKKKRAYWFYLNGEYFKSALLYISYYLSKFLKSLLLQRDKQLGSLH